MSALTTITRRDPRTGPTWQRGAISSDLWTTPADASRARELVDIIANADTALWTIARERTTNRTRRAELADLRDTFRADRATALAELAALTPRTVPA